LGWMGCEGNGVIERGFWNSLKLLSLARRELLILGR
jgi:hypothetical protein